MEYQASQIVVINSVAFEMFWSAADIGVLQCSTTFTLRLEFILHRHWHKNTAFYDPFEAELVRATARLYAQRKTQERGV